MDTLIQQLTTFETQLQNLKDQDLVIQVENLLNREKRIGDAILLALKEINARRIYAAMGYPSLFYLLVRHFKLSETAAYTRLQALRLMETVPGVQANMLKGELSLNNAALIQSFVQRHDKEHSQPMTVESKKEIIDAVKGKTNKEAREILANKDPQAALPPPIEKPLAQNHTQLQITVDAETMAALREVKALLSHKIPDGDLKAILKYMIQATGEQLKKRKGYGVLEKSGISASQCFTDGEKGRVNEEFRNARKVENEDRRGVMSKEGDQGTERDLGKEGDQSAEMSGEGNFNRSGVQKMRKIKENSVYPKGHSQRVRQNIPVNIKRNVFTRSGGCCEFVSPGGIRCSSQYQLEFDHLIPWSQGGKNGEDSLRVLCRVHNQYRTKQTHGFWYQKKR